MPDNVVCVLLINVGAGLSEWLGPQGGGLVLTGLWGILASLAVMTDAGPNAVPTPRDVWPDVSSRLEGLAGAASELTGGESIVG